MNALLILSCRQNDDRLRRLNQERTTGGSGADMEEGDAENVAEEGVELE